MLTPAEELGLSGLSLASRVRKAFYKIPEAELPRPDATASREADPPAPHLPARRPGRDAIRVLPARITVLPDQLAYIHFVSLTIQNALKRLPELYLQDFGRPRVLRLPPEEEEWLWDCWGPSQRENNPVFGRLDAMVDFISPMWKDSLRFVEPNLSGIGGLHLVPTCEHIVADLVLPVLQAAGRRVCTWNVGQDIRELLMQEVLDHLEALGRPARHICFVEPKYAGSGPDEQEALAQLFPRPLRPEGHARRPGRADAAAATRSTTTATPIDLAYRDYAVCDLLDLEREGVDVEPMRTLVPAEPHHLVDRGRAGSEKLLGSADRSAVHAEVLQRRRAAGLPPAHPVDAHPLRPRDAAARRPDRATCWTTSAGSRRRWC